MEGSFFGFETSKCALVARAISSVFLDLDKKMPLKYFIPWWYQALTRSGGYGWVGFKGTLPELQCLLYFTVNQNLLGILWKTLTPRCHIQRFQLSRTPVETKRFRGCQFPDCSLLKSAPVRTLLQEGGIRNIFSQRGRKSNLPWVTQQVYAPKEHSGSKEACWRSRASWGTEHISRRENKQANRIDLGGKGGVGREGG